MSLFKRAFARGVNDELIRLGYVRYPTKEAADEVADAVGDQMPVEPAAEAIPAEVGADVATQLIDAANQLVEAAGGGAGGEEVPPEMAAGMEEAAKQSAAADIDTRAYQQAEAVMVKSAMQTKEALGSTIEGGDKGNQMSDSPQGETVMENKDRPQGTHVLGVGNTKHPVGQGNVGTEQVPAPNTSNSPGESPDGSNSVIQQSKLGTALQQIIQKVAAGMGSTIEGGDKGNTLPQAGSATGEGKIEADRRPMGYAHKGVQAVGQTDFPVGAGVVGSEQAHPDQPGESPGGAAGGGGNTVVDWSSAAADGPKAAADNSAYIALFGQTAQKVAQHLPANLNEEQKIAHVRQMMGMTDVEQSQYIGMLHKEAGATDDEAVAAAEKHAECARNRYKNPYGRERKDRTKDNQKQAGEMPPAFKEKMDEVKEKAEAKSEGESPAVEKKEEKKEEKTESGEKEAMDLLSRIRRVSQQTLNA
jgi:hypothetical protein